MIGESHVPAKASRRTPCLSGDLIVPVRPGVVMRVQSHVFFEAL